MEGEALERVLAGWLASIAITAAEVSTATVGIDVEGTLSVDLETGDAVGTTAVVRWSGWRVCCEEVRGRFGASGLSQARCLGVRFHGPRVRGMAARAHWASEVIVLEDVVLVRDGLVLEAQHVQVEDGVRLTSRGDPLRLSNRSPPAAVEPCAPPPP